MLFYFEFVTCHDLKARFEGTICGLMSDLVGLGKQSLYILIEP